MLDPEDYETQRDQARQMMVLLEQEVVLGKAVPTAPSELKLAPQLAPAPTVEPSPEPAPGATVVPATSPEPAQPASPSAQ